MRRAQGGMRSAPVPRLDVRPPHMANARSAELVPETAGTDRFLTDTIDDLYYSAETLARYRARPPWMSFGARAGGGAGERYD